MEIMKPAKNYYFFRGLKKKHIPLHIQIELTTRCNNNCLHCIREKDIKNELTAPELRKVIFQLNKAGCMQLTFTGGEALLRKDFFEISGFARSQGFLLRLFTNGTLIDEPVAKRLKKYGYSEIRITLFSIKEKIHDSITQVPGSLRKTLGAIELLKKHKVPFRIGAVIMKQNIYEIKRLRERAEEENWKFSCDPTIYPTYTGSKDPVLNRLTDEEIRYLKDKGILNCLRYKNVNSKKNELTSFYQGNLHCYISAGGGVFPHATIRLRLGDVKNQSFEKIWRNSPVLRGLRNLGLRNFECFYCDDFLTCPWNLGLALSEHGRVTAKPEEYCRITNIKRR